MIKRNLPRFYIGPMSKNVVDCCIDFSLNNPNKIGFIPSRRQIEKTGGYVNRWDTKSFSQYCSNVLIKRDHAGPSQGQTEDDLKRNLNSKIFKNIDYLVIQSGTSLKGNVNTGVYNKDRLCKMVGVAKKHNVLSKEHNGDYISPTIIKEKMSLGLDSINIAPEFGLIETKCYLESDIDFEKFWKICFLSRKWEKWVDSSFDPYSQKVDLVKICGHYVFSNPEFIKIKPDIENKIKFKINEKLHELSY